jgi:hypothetical protein
MFTKCRRTKGQNTLMLCYWEGIELLWTTLYSVMWCYFILSITFKLHPAFTFQRSFLFYALKINTISSIFPVSLSTRLGHKSKLALKDGINEWTLELIEWWVGAHITNIVRWVGSFLFASFLDRMACWNHLEWMNSNWILNWRKYNPQP